MFVNSLLRHVVFLAVIFDNHGQLLGSQHQADLLLAGSEHGNIYARHPAWTRPQLAQEVAREDLQAESFQRRATRDPALLFGSEEIRTGCERQQEHHQIDERRQRERESVTGRRRRKKLLEG